MTNETQLSGGIVSHFEEALREQASNLKNLIDKGDFSAAMSVISDLNETRDKNLFQEVGRLTRSLHESIRNFHIDTNDSSANEGLSTIGDASDRLAYVVKMTSKAANKTLDLVEETMPYASEISSEAKLLKDDWTRLQRKEMKPDEFRAMTEKMAVFLGKLSDDSDKVCQNLSEILLAQDYQDLTGQVINRVTGLVKDVEENLVNLVRMAGKVDLITGTVHEEEDHQKTGIEGEGPQIHAEKRDNVVSGQDDVDDLLSSLGF